jgi:HSP20 family molecular chaperone IbpA
MEDFDDKVTCELSSDGVLTVTVPRPVPTKDGENGVVGKVNT